LAAHALHPDADAEERRRLGAQQAGRVHLGLDVDEEALADADDVARPEGRLRRAPPADEDAVPAPEIAQPVAPAVRIGLDDGVLSRHLAIVEHETGLLAGLAAERHRLPVEHDGLPRVRVRAPRQAELADALRLRLPLARPRRSGLPAGGSE